MPVQRSQLELALQDLFGDKGVLFYSEIVHRNYTSFRRSINDAHSGPYHYVALTCDLLYRLRFLGENPTKVLTEADKELPIPSRDDPMGGVAEHMSSLLGPDYAVLLSAQLYRPTRSIERGLVTPSCMAYPHLRNIAFLLQLTHFHTRECPRCVLRNRANFSFKKQVRVKDGC